MKKNRWIIPTILLLGALTLFSNANFARPDVSPVEIVKARNQAIENILDEADDNITTEIREKLKEVINGVMDFRELSRLSLGKYWKQRTPKEQDDFVKTFSQLIKNSSVKKLEIYKADKMVYEEAEINGSKAKVTTIAFKKRKEVEIVYKMHKVDGQWLVYDIEIDGVSTARNYRESFYKQIAKNSYEEMYNKLVKKLEEK
ncbi:MAG: phospholipid-binding protein MlaC [bacterium]